MKFWVRVQRQGNMEELLLVDAESPNELRAHLEELLHTTIEQMSITDFQAQVRDQIKNGSEIIAVNLQEESEDAGTPCGSRMRRNSLPSQQPWIVDAPSSALFQESITTRRPPSRPNSSLGFDAPNIESICLRRQTLQLLLHASTQKQFVDVVIGSFVRLRECNGYCISQINDLDGEYMRVDLVHISERRMIGTASDALPPPDELRSWAKRMTEEDRPLVTDIFVQSKALELQNAVMRAKAIVDRFRTSVISNSCHADDSATNELHLDEFLHRQESSAPCLSVNPQESPMQGSDSYSTPVRGFARSSLCGGTTMFAPPFPTGRSILRLSDQIVTGWISQLALPEGTSQTVFFYSRRSNARSKAARWTDWAASAASMNDSLTEALWDRDVTFKGWRFWCAPQSFHGTHRVFASRVLGAPKDTILGQPSATRRMSGGANEYSILRGGSSFELYEVEVDSVSLPLPPFAANGSRIWNPQLVATEEAMLAFYLVEVKGPQEDQMALGLVCAVADDLLSSWVLRSKAPIRTSKSSTPLFFVSFGPFGRAPTQPTLSLLWADLDANATVALSVEEWHAACNPSWEQPFGQCVLPSGADWWAGGLHAISLLRWLGDLFVCIVAANVKRQSTVVFLKIGVVAGSDDTQIKEIE